MIDYYSYFGFKKDSSILEVVDKLALFLMRVREEASKLYSDDEKTKMLNSALRIVQDVCRIFTVAHEREAYDDLMREQMIISSKLYKNKIQVLPFEDFYIKAKKSWLRILTCLIPHLESEKQMSFLKDDDYSEILNFMIENTNPYFISNDSNTNNYFVSLEIVKQSFGIAKTKGRNNVKVEDIVTAINQSTYLNDENRSRLAVMVFDRWYKQEAPSENNIVYHKI